MEADAPAVLPDAFAVLQPGPLLHLCAGNIEVAVAPLAGGRIAQIRREGIEQLAGFAETNASLIGWGCYPLLPWAGRIRRGAFQFEGRHYQLPVNMSPHSIHGVGFAMAWNVEFHDERCMELALELPQDERWPFGGSAHQRMELTRDRLRLELSVRAGSRAMPATIGWHPWFRKPERLDFSPSAVYPRDLEGIATLPLAAPPAGPWDDCFANVEAVGLDYEGRQLRLRSDCTHWVVYDYPAVTTCVEPQSGPPDAFNIEPLVLSAGQTLTRWFELEWSAV